MIQDAVYGWRRRIAPIDDTISWLKILAAVIPICGFPSQYVVFLVKLLRPVIEYLPGRANALNVLSEMESTAPRRYKNPENLL